MEKPLICITSDTNGEEGRGREMCFPKLYALAVEAAGGVPIVAAECCPEQLAEVCDGLLLSGGDDFEPQYYGEEILNDTVKTDPARGAFEVPLIEAFLREKKPIMGICRGHQLINCILGGTLYQDLLEQKGLVHFNSGIRHEVRAVPGSILHRLFGEVFKTNSTHHQSIKDLGRGFKVTATSIEGLVEAIEHDSLPIFAVQFHPERLTGAANDGRTPDFAPLFKHFISLVDNARGN